MPPMLSRLRDVNHQGHCPTPHHGLDTQSHHQHAVTQERSGCTQRQRARRQGLQRHRRSPPVRHRCPKPQPCLLRLPVDIRMCICRLARIMNTRQQIAYIETQISIRSSIYGLDIIDPIPKLQSLNFINSSRVIKHEAGTVLFHEIMVWGKKSHPRSTMEVWRPRAITTMMWLQGPDGPELFLEKRVAPGADGLVNIVKPVHTLQNRYLVHGFGVSLLRGALDESVLLGI